MAALETMTRAGFKSDRRRSARVPAELPGFATGDDSLPRHRPGRAPAG